MTFADEVQRVGQSIDAIIEVGKTLTPELIAKIEKLQTINVDELLTAATVLMQSGDEVQQVVRGLDDIKNVVKSQNQIHHVSDMRDTIGLVAGMKDTLEFVRVYNNDYKRSREMNEDISSVLSMKPLMEELVGMKGEIEGYRFIDESIRDRITSLEKTEKNINDSVVFCTDIMNKMRIVEKRIDEKLAKVEELKEEIETFSISTETVDYNIDSCSSYDPVNNVLTLHIREGRPGVKGEPGQAGDRGIPGEVQHRGLQGEQGVPGIKGKDFKIDAMGPIVKRSRYGNRPVGFSFMALDLNPTMVYFRKSNTLDDWTDGQPFGSSDGGYAKKSADTEKIMGMNLAELTKHIRNKGA